MLFLFLAKIVNSIWFIKSQGLCYGHAKLEKKNIPYQFKPKKITNVSNKIILLIKEKYLNFVDDFLTQNEHYGKS